MHLAETREQAMKDVEYGLQKWVDYFSRVNASASGSDLGSSTPAQAMVESGRAVIGTPDDAIAQIERMRAKVGDFGCFLMLAHNWASFDRTKQSYELFARHVMPVINRRNAWRSESLTHYTDNKHELMGKVGEAMRQTFDKHKLDIAKASEARKAERGTKG
jgi:limonene 1,2-monooxygenase